MRTRHWVLFGLGLCSSVALIVACVGDDPSPAAAPGTDAGGTSDSGPGPGPNDSGGDSDASIVDSGSDAAKRYCETVTKPLAPAEFFCADFDGPDAGEGWTSAFRPDGGTLEQTTEVSVSSPNALVAHPVTNVAFATGPRLDWKSVGAKNFVKAELRARMNPTIGGLVTPYNGVIKLLEIRTTNASVGLYYTNGAELLSPSQASDDYVGYFIRTAAFGGAATQNDWVVPTALAANTWTEVKLTWQSNGQTNLAYNSVSIFNEGLHGSTDTSVTFQVGAESNAGAVTEVKRMRYDDVQITLDRAQ